MFTIKSYSEKYQASYCNLYIETWKAEPYGELFTNDEIVDHMVKNSRYHYLLVEEETDTLLGFVAGRPLVNDCPFFLNETNIDLTNTFYIDELGVLDAHRKRGWAQTLMRYLMSCAREQGFEQFVLRTHSGESNPALKLYDRLGFKTRPTSSGEIHGVATQQTRIDSRPQSDLRIYFYFP
jgi:ribosomal protein S18 acetylase RimI-like enzyme